MCRSATQTASTSGVRCVEPWTARTLPSERSRHGRLPTPHSSALSTIKPQNWRPLRDDVAWRQRWHDRLGRGGIEPEGKFYERLAALREEQDRLKGKLQRAEDEAQNSHEAFVCASGAIDDRDAKLNSVLATLVRVEQEMRVDANKPFSAEYLRARIDQWADQLASLRKA